MRLFAKLVIIAGALSVLTPILAKTAAAITRISTSGDKITERHSETCGWPNGVRKFVNGPLRTDAWLPWFSGQKTSVEFYEFALKSEEDVQSVINEFATIKSSKIRIVWAQGREPRSIGGFPVKRNILKLIERKKLKGTMDFIAVMGGKGTNAVFSVGNRKTLDLLEASGMTEDQKEKFGCYPTLTIYKGSAFIEPSRVAIPKHIRVLNKK